MSLMKQLLSFISLLMAFACHSQTGKFTDTRDGQVYNTIIIGNNKWFQENLRFQTNKSFCPNFNKKNEDCSSGNYYSNSELQTVCPSGWHVSTILEWEAYIHFMLKAKNLDSSLFKYDTSKYFANHFAMRLKSANLLGDSLLNLKAIGWVEGYKLKEKTGLSLWLIDTQTGDDKYHMHGSKYGFVKHSHDHNIIDKPSLIRKFPVRCVCEFSQQGN
jgi:uncharacterized protein (TIGR02145 family)